MKIQIFDSIQKLKLSDWQDVTPSEFPFASYAFLQTLEETGCLGSRTGWMPLYITAWQDNRLMGAFLCFQKTNSYGEYIFDFAWAQAFEHQGLNYYPKLLSAIPFTPATGPKILLSRQLELAEKSKVAKELIAAAKDLSAKNQMSSTHVLFMTENEIPYFTDADFFIRHSFQYHWQNEGFTSFEDFLAKLRAKRRKEIHRERAQCRASGVEILRLTGNQLTGEHSEAMAEFYSSTVQKMGGFEYLTPLFFEKIFSRMKDQILLVLAKDADGKSVAGALNYFGDSTLFGRHWGCREEHKALHFELCYYQGIEFAIEKKFKLFEAGAQGEHKFQRGFLPRKTLSAHQIHDPQLRLAIEDFVQREKRQIDRLFAEYAELTPFSRQSVQAKNSLIT